MTIIPIQTMTIGIHAVPYRLLTKRHRHYKIHARLPPEAREGQALEGAIRDIIVQQDWLWYLHPEMQHHPLQERRQFQHGTGRKVEICNIGKPLTNRQWRLIRRGLAAVSTVIPQGMWSLQRICLRADEPFNVTSGLPLRGVATGEREFVLFPFGLDLERPVASDFGMLLPPGTTELEATIAHECGHCMVEPHLRNAWIHRFGWISVQDYPAYDVRTLNGERPAYVCLQPEGCLREYGRFSPSEDIADSVAAYIYRPSLLEKGRLRMLRTILRVPRPVQRVGRLPAIPLCFPRKVPVNILLTEERLFSPVPSTEPQMPEPPKTEIIVHNFVRGIRDGTIQRPIREHTASS